MFMLYSSLSELDVNYVKYLKLIMLWFSEICRKPSLPIRVALQAY